MPTSPTTVSMNVDDKATKREMQDANVQAVASRVRIRAESMNYSSRSFGAALGLSSSTVANYWTGKRAWPSELLAEIADLLKISLDQLLRGASHRGAALIDANDADWLEIPEYALLEIDEQGKLDPISVTTMRRDWLYSTLGETANLWIARLPAPYDAIGLNTGTPLICKDHRPGERMIDGTHYLFRVNGGIVMARFAFRDDGSGDRLVLSRDLGHEEDQYQVVARVVGVIAHPI